ncbi:MAG TPA: cytochrome c oxidase subunit 3 [Blastocatellia bacterium]|nr:cytochrome c oxidase subunit 3 [Blastocatellia bacterium]
MAEARVETRMDSLTTNDWGGGVLPYRVGHRKLGMWLFIMSDSLTFCALLIGYSYLRFASPNWPRPFPFYPSIVFSTVMTLVLLSSSMTMVMAVMNAMRGRKSLARRWIFATMFFGTAFIVLHAIEWGHLMEEGVALFENPWGDPMFGATFFAITGLHMFHVFTGVCYLGVVALRIKKMTSEDVEVSGLYWHFVDLVWMFVFPLIYLLSVDFGGAAH